MPCISPTTSIGAGDELQAFFLEEDTLDIDFASSGRSAKDCIQLLAASHELTLARLAGVADSELETIFPIPRSKPEFQSSLRWIIHHLIDHEAHHKGQIAMLKRLIRDK